MVSGAQSIGGTSTTTFNNISNYWNQHSNRHRKHKCHQLTFGTTSTAVTAGVLSVNNGVTTAVSGAVNND